jgi:orotate phosphoribosyltransferase
MAAIFTYGFEISEQKFKENNVTLFTLSNYDNLLKLAIEKKYVEEAELITLQEWSKNPSVWNK